MKIYTDKISFKTDGNCDIINITVDTAKIVAKSGVKNGLLNVFIPGATGAITTIEYEPGLESDLKNLLKTLIRENADYGHNKTHSDGNASSHLRASLIGPSLSVQITDGKMDLGVWQNIIFVDMDNRPRDRAISVKIIGE